MKKEVISVPELFSLAHYGFSQCVKFGELIFVTGQGGIDREGKLVSRDVAEQTRATFRNIELALIAAGSDLSKLLKMTSFIVDFEKNGAAYLQARKEALKDMGFTSATIGVSCLVIPELLVEVQCIAHA